MTEVLLFAAAIAQPADPLRFSSRDERGGFVIVGENTDPVTPYHVVVSFPQLENLRPSVGLPARLVLAPGTARDLVQLVRIDPDRGVGMRSAYRYGRGDPAAVPTPGFLYLLPWEHGVKHHVDQGYFGATTHRGLHALDFDLAEGSRVCAARAGVVIAVKADSNVGGPGGWYADKGNHVDILHEDGTWANYAHLRFHGAFVKPGDRVAAGQVVGLSGRTGQASGPHLHFAVFRASWDAEGGETVPTVFLGLEGKAVGAEEGRAYYAVHPGGPLFAVALGGRLTDLDYEKVTRPAAPTGKVTVRADTVDEKVFVWCANGTAEPQEVTVRFPVLTNFGASRRLPYVRVVPGRTEVFLLSLVRRAAGAARYEVSYAWKPAAAPRSPTRRSRR